MKKITVTLYVIDAIRVAMALIIVIALASCTKEKQPVPPDTYLSSGHVKTYAFFYQ